MRNQINKLLIKCGWYLTKAPALLSEKLPQASPLIPADLSRHVTVSERQDTPDNELFRIFSADTNVHKWHHYFDIYSRYFERYRNHPITMLEIGVFRGGSLRMWREYFHAESTIVGIDVDKSCQTHEIKDKNVFVRIGSQADTDFLSAVNDEFGPFDIILDDGSHKTHHQIVSFGALFGPALKEGGCYMCEDVHSNYWANHMDSPETFIDLSKQLVDVMHEQYIDYKESDFRHGSPDAVKQLELSYLSAHLDSISFHDSIVVIDKKKQNLPKSELR